MSKESDQQEENKLEKIINEWELITYRGKLQLMALMRKKNFVIVSLSKVVKKVIVQDNRSRVH